LVSYIAFVLCYINVCATKVAPPEILLFEVGTLVPHFNEAKASTPFVFAGVGTSVPLFAILKYLPQYYS